MGERRQGGGRRCLAEGCGRMVQPGRLVCATHKRTAAGREAAEALRHLVVSAVQGETDRRKDGETERRRELAEGFRRRLERGEYRALVDERLREVMAQAAAERGLSEEIGALRFAMARLLAEEEDPVRLSLGVSRLATASARLARTRRDLDQGYEPLNEAISQILRELDGEPTM